jgi:hypothetical protein
MSRITVLVTALTLGACSVPNLSGFPRVLRGLVDARGLLADRGPCGRTAGRGSKRSETAGTDLADPRSRGCRCVCGEFARADLYSPRAREALRRLRLQILNHHPN